MDVRYWKCLERHALSGSYEDIIGKAWVSYVENLRKFGIVDGRKIVLYEGLVIDGWQLYRGCIEADIRPDFRELKLPKGMTADEWVETMNDLRRHETQDAAMCRIAERRERIAAARISGESLRSIAEQEEVSVSTVVEDIEAVTVQGGTVTPPDGKIKGKDAREQPATKPKTLCDRCTRTGAVKGCERCKEVRKPKKKESEPVADEPWVDEWGIPITKEASKAFAAQEKFDELLTVLRKAKSLYKELADDPGGAFLTRPGVSLNSKHAFIHAGLETCILNVKDCRPTYTVCPYAYAENHKHGKDCTLCHGLGWTRPLGKEEVPASLVKAAKQAHGVS